MTGTGVIMRNSLFYLNPGDFFCTLISGLPLSYMWQISLGQMAALRCGLMSGTRTKQDQSKWFIETSRSVRLHVIGVCWTAQYNLNEQSGVNMKSLSPTTGRIQCPSFSDSTNVCFNPHFIHFKCDRFQMLCTIFVSSCFTSSKLLLFITETHQMHFLHSFTLFKQIYSITAPLSTEIMLSYIIAADHNVTL